MNNFNIMSDTLAEYLCAWNLSQYSSRRTHYNIDVSLQNGFHLLTVKHISHSWDAWCSAVHIASREIKHVPFTEVRVSYVRENTWLKKYRLVADICNTVHCIEHDAEACIARKPVTMYNRDAPMSKNADASLLFVKSVHNTLRDVPNKCIIMDNPKCLTQW